MNTLRPFVIAVCLFGLTAPSFTQAASMMAAPAIQVTGVKAVTSSGMANVTITPSKIVPPPSCTIRASSMKIRSGDSTTIVWRSKGASVMTGFGTTDFREVHGEQRLAIGFPGTWDFTLKFFGTGGETDCTVRIIVQPKAQNQ